MIAFLSGNIVTLEPTYLILDVNGVGYHVNIPLSAYEQFKDKTKVSVLTHLHVKEDAHTLYGFFNENEKNTFQDLIGISGIGPSTALGMLSAMSPGEIKGAIAAENVKQIQSIKGIGGKTAQRVILELKDKYKKEALVTEPLPTSSSTKSNTMRSEALSALVTLGYAKNSAEKVIDKLLEKNGENISLEQLIKLALKSA
jgi:Holliday junction DNA helicase RuvA